MKKIIAFLLVAVAICISFTAKSQTFSNPIFKSQDPWVTFINGKYYYTESYCGIADICVKVSNTLTGLASSPWIGVWSHANNGDSNSSNIWAPELHYIQNHWYIYYAADNGDNNNHRLFVLTTDGGATTQFHEAETGAPHGQLRESTGFWGIDPNVFIAADQNLYLTWSCTNQNSAAFPQRICLAPLKDALTVSGPTVFLSTPTASWETRGAPIQEGPVGYTRGGRSYITFSASASWIANGYAVGVLALTPGASPTNAAAWSKSGPILDHHGTVYGPGSVVFVPSLNGKEYWNVYHAIDSTSCMPAYTCRDVRMQKMYFNSTGYPVLGYPINPGVVLPDPSGEGGVTGGKTLVEKFGPAWGDAAAGNFSGGAVMGSWNNSAGSLITSSLGGSWDQIFVPSNPNSTDILAHVETQLVALGISNPFRKYGMYCTYDDSNNHAEMFLDPYYYILATHAVAGGVDQGWMNTNLPVGFDFTAWHTLDCKKNGAQYIFTVDQTSPSAVSQTRMINLTNGQAGLIVVDTKANFKNLSLISQ